MPVDQARIRWLKQAGELFFANACNDSGLTSTRPDEDERGWDFFVEMPQNRLPAIFLDAQPTPIKFLCQVKASDDLDDRKRSITVANMENLCRSVLPAFVLMLDFQGQKTPKKGYLCHLDERRIGQTLKRITELQEHGKTDLRKHEITVTSDIGEEIDLTRDDWVSNRVLNIVGIDADKYAKWKMDFLKVVGFDNVNMIMQFGTLMTKSETVDAFLGLRELDVVDVSIFRRRFGIDLPTDFAASGKLTVEAMPIGECYGIVTSRRANRRIRHPVEVRVPGLPELSLENFKARIDWPFTQFILAHNRVGVTISIEADAIHKLSELIFATELFEICSYPDAQILFYSLDGQFASIQINTPIQKDAAFLHVAAQLRFLRSFLDRAEFRDDIELNLNHIYSQSEEIKWMKTLLGRRPVMLSGNRASFERISSASKKGVFARPIAFELPDQIFIAFCEWPARVSITPEEAIAKVKKGNVWGTTLISTQNPEPALAVHRDFERFCRDNVNGFLIYQGLNEEAFKLSNGSIATNGNSTAE